MGLLTHVLYFFKSQTEHLDRFIFFPITRTVLISLEVLLHCFQTDKLFIIAPYLRVNLVFEHFEGKLADLPSRNVRLCITVSYAASQVPRPTPKIHIADQCAFEYLDMTVWKSPSADTFIRPYRRPCSHTPPLSCLVLSLFHLCLNSWATHSFCTWVWGFQQHHFKNVSWVQCTLVQKVRLHWFS